MIIGENCMVRIAILSDAHLLMQADWVEDEDLLTGEGLEVLENFERALTLVEKDRSDAVLLAGDMLDYRTKRGYRVAHREGEKYMARVRAAFDDLAESVGCKIYALKGNHDSEAVLRSTEKALKGKFVYVKNNAVEIGGLNAFFMDSRYQQGFYEISLENIVPRGDLLIMHESIPIWGISGLSKEMLKGLCGRFKLVVNGHMHTFLEGALSIPNLCLTPALIPSREIKKNWMLMYEYPDSLEPKTRETPFGYLLLDEKDLKFRPYEPLQTVVRVGVKGEKVDDLLEGVRTVYDILSEREDKHKLRVWVEVQADPITIQRVLRPEIMRYKDIWTVDIERLPIKPEIREIKAPKVEFGDKAFSRRELIESVLNSLEGAQKELARKIFNEIFTKEDLLGRPKEPYLFKRFLEIASEGYDVSEIFTVKAWELAKR